MNYWKKADEELAYARQAREFENEGMARVCARRAGGWAIKGYLADHSLAIPTPNAMDLLKDPNIQSIFPGQIKIIIQHLSKTISLEKGTDGIDLILETQELINTLKNQAISEKS